MIHGEGEEEEEEWVDARRFSISRVVLFFPPDLGQRKRIFHRRNGKTTGARRDHDRSKSNDTAGKSSLDGNGTLEENVSFFSLPLFLSRCFQSLCSIVRFRAVPSVVRVKWFSVELVRVAIFPLVTLQSSKFAKSYFRPTKSTTFGEFDVKRTYIKRGCRFPRTGRAGYFQKKESVVGKSWKSFPRTVIVPLARFINQKDQCFPRTESPSVAPPLLHDPPWVVTTL